MLKLKYGLKTNTQIDSIRIKIKSNTFLPPEVYWLGTENKNYEKKYIVPNTDTGTFIISK